MKSETRFVTLQDITNCHPHATKSRIMLEHGRQTGTPVTFVEISALDREDLVGYPKFASETAR